MKLARAATVNFSPPPTAPPRACLISHSVPARQPVGDAGASLEAGNPGRFVGANHRGVQPGFCCLKCTLPIIYLCDNVGHWAFPSCTDPFMNICLSSAPHRSAAIAAYPTLPPNFLARGIFAAAVHHEKLPRARHQLCQGSRGTQSPAPGTRNALHVALAAPA